MKIRQRIIGILLSFIVLFYLSCHQPNISAESLIYKVQPDEISDGYNDILINSQTILWGSSIEILKNTFPNVIYETYDEIFIGNPNDKTFHEYNFNGEKTIRFFDFINNQLWRVGVSYGQKSNSELDLLREELQKKYGLFPIEDNGTIESWYLELNEHNEIVFVINKLQNNTINTSYINPQLREIHMKECRVIK